MRTAHYLLLDNLMKYYPLSKGREYFMLHQYDVLNDNE